MAADVLTSAPTASAEYLLIIAVWPERTNSHGVEAGIGGNAPSARRFGEAGEFRGCEGLSLTEKCALEVFLPLPRDG